MKKIKVLMIVGMVSVMLAACGGRENEGGNEINASVSASEAQQDDFDSRNGVCDACGMRRTGK